MRPSGCFKDPQGRASHPYGDGGRSSLEPKLRRGLTTIPLSSVAARPLTRGPQGRTREGPPVLAEAGEPELRHSPPRLDLRWYQVKKTKKAVGRGGVGGV